MNVSTLTPNLEHKPAEEIKKQEGAKEGEDEEIDIEEQIEEPQHEKKMINIMKVLIMQRIELRVLMNGQNSL